MTWGRPLDIWSGIRMPWGTRVFRSSNCKEGGRERERRLVKGPSLCVCVLIQGCNFNRYNVIHVHMYNIISEFQWGTEACTKRASAFYSSLILTQSFHTKINTTCDGACQQIHTYMVCWPFSKPTYFGSAFCATQIGVPGQAGTGWESFL